MRVIAIVNQKGGCGKTTTAINLAGFLASEQRRTLVIDMDPQGHATLGLLSEAVEPDLTMSDVLIEADPTVGLREIVQTAQDDLYVAPSNILLAGVQDTLAGVRGREDRLADQIKRVDQEYDYVLIDCPPGVGLLTFNALTACSEAISPMDPSFFALHGVAKLLETFDLLERRTGHEIVARALVTLYAGRSAFVREVLDEIRTHLKDRHYQTVIRYSVKLAEAASHGLPISSYGRCAGFEDYAALTAEVLAREIESSTGVRPVEVEAKGSGSTTVGPKVTQEGVLFTFEAPSAHRVQLVGDFNDWALDANEMTSGGRVWKSILKLEPGRYRYRYVVDGNWQSDPANPKSEPSPYGGQDSVLVLE